MCTFLVLLFGFQIYAWIDLHVLLAAPPMAGDQGSTLGYNIDKNHKVKLSVGSS